MDEKESKHRDRGHRYTPVLVAIVGAFLGSTGGFAVYVNTPLGQEITRPDPFYGSQASALIKRVSHLETAITDHTLKHPDIVGQFDRRIAVLESQYAIILQNQGRILDRLDDR